MARPGEGGAGERELMPTAPTAITAWSVLGGPGMSGGKKNMLMAPTAPVSRTTGERNYLV